MNFALLKSRFFHTYALFMGLFILLVVLDFYYIQYCTGHMELNNMKAPLDLIARCTILLLIMFLLICIQYKLISGEIQANNGLNVVWNPVHGSHMTKSGGSGLL